MYPCKCLIQHFNTLTYGLAKPIGLHAHVGWSEPGLRPSSTAQAHSVLIRVVIICTDSLQVPEETLTSPSGVESVDTGSCQDTFSNSWLDGNPWAINNSISSSSSREKDRGAKQALLQWGSTSAHSSSGAFHQGNLKETLENTQNTGRHTHSAASHWTGTWY